MKNTENFILKNDFKNLKILFLEYIKLNENKFNQEDFRAFYYILKIFDNIIQILDTKTLPPKEQRYAVLSRAVIELSPSILDPELGGKIIELERKYIEL